MVDQGAKIERDWLEQERKARVHVDIDAQIHPYCNTEMVCTGRAAHLEWVKIGMMQKKKRACERETKSARGRGSPFGTKSTCLRTHYVDVNKHEHFDKHKYQHQHQQLNVHVNVNVNVNVN